MIGFTKDVVSIVFVASAKIASNLSLNSALNSAGAVTLLATGGVESKWIASTSFSYNSNSSWVSAAR